MGKTEAELRREADSERARMGQTLEAIGDRLSPERMLERRKAKIGHGFKAVRESVMGSSDYQEPMTQRMRDAASSATERVQHAPDMLTNQARGNPIAAGVVAFGFGMLAATLFPETQTERRLAGAAGEPLAQAGRELQGVGRDLGQDAKQVGQNAAQEVKAATTDAASTVRDEARSAAEQVRDEVRKT